MAGQVIDTGSTIASVARDLGLGEQLVGRWVKLERQRRAAEAEGEPTPADLAAENAALRRRIRQLETGSDFQESRTRASVLFASRHPYLSASS